MFTLYNDNCLEALKKMQDNSLDGCITDPPYHLSYNDKKTGFMHNDWDGGDIAFKSDTWKEVLRVLKPGASLLAFGGTRTYHRLTVAIEDAGFEIRDCLMFLYGSGMPKGQNIALSIEKAKKGYPQGGFDPTSPNHGKYKTGGGNGASQYTETGEYKVLEINNEWTGYNTTLKPAWEPIVFAMKPLDGTFVQNANKWGVAGINVDKCRIAINPDIDDPRLGGKGCWSTDKMAKNVYEGGYTGEVVSSSPLGRYPANVILTHSENCKFIETRKIKNKSGGVAGNEPSHTGDENTNCYGEFKRVPFQKYGDENGMEDIEIWECSPDCPIFLLDQQSGIKKSGVAIEPEAKTMNRNIYGETKTLGRECGYNDCGGASRFFYCAKASKKDRNLGLKDKTNNHPTTKPINLMRYLCKLISMPHKSLILDPFMGSGTTGIACILENMDFVGIELKKEYFDIAQDRLSGIELNSNINI